MNKDIMGKIRNLLQHHERMKQGKRVVTVLSLLIVMFTVYMLALQAITLERDAYACGLEQHVHEEECYALQPVLVCGFADEVNDGEIATDASGDSLLL